MTYSTPLCLVGKPTSSFEAASLSRGLEAQSMLKVKVVMNTLCRYPFITIHSDNLCLYPWHVGGRGRFQASRGYVVMRPSQKRKKTKQKSKRRVAFRKQNELGTLHLRWFGEGGSAQRSLSQCASGLVRLAVGPSIGLRMRLIV